MDNSISEKQEIGSRLKKYREEANVTQQEMAEFADLSKNYISALERGINKMNVQTLIAYCKKLNVPPDILLGLEDLNTVNPELMSLIVNLNDEKQQVVIDIIRALK